MSILEVFCIHLVMHSVLYCTVSLIIIRSASKVVFVGGGGGGDTLYMCTKASLCNVQNNQFQLAIRLYSN